MKQIKKIDVVNGQTTHGDVRTQINRAIDDINANFDEGGAGGANLTGYASIGSEAQLPSNPSGIEQTLGYLIGTDLYVYVGKGGTTADGKYKNCGPFRGPKGQDGAQGNSGFTGTAGELEVVNNLTQGGAIAALSAEQGKKINDTIQIEEKTDSFDIIDLKGYILARIDKEGINTVNFRSEYPDSLYITDEDGHVALSVTKDGLDYIHKGESSGQVISKKDDGRKPTDVVYNILYGQSLSYHGWISEGMDMSTTLQFDTADNYMLLSLTEDVLNDPAQLASYFAKGFIPSKHNISGTAIAHANLMCMKLLDIQNGVDIAFEKDSVTPKYFFQMLGCSTGQVASWDQLSRTDGVIYRRTLESVRQAKRIANEQGKTFSVGCFCYMQGENSADCKDTKKRWHDKLWVLFSNLDYDIKEITGQTNDIFYLPYQYASQVGNTAAGGSIGVPLGALQISLEDGDGTSYVLDDMPKIYLREGVQLIDRKFIRMGAVMNSLDYKNDSDQVHASDNSYPSAGAQWGLQIKRCIYDNDPVVPIHVLSHQTLPTKDGYVVILEMHVPVAPLVLDTANLECQSQRATLPNKGFSILNSRGEEIITEVTIHRGNEVYLKVSENPSGFTLTYAKDGWIKGGNLRDSQELTYIANGFNYKVHNWCPTFDLDII